VWSTARRAASADHGAPPIAPGRPRGYNDWNPDTPELHPGIMKIYLSSTQSDLAAHRLAVAHVLRQSGHQVVHMEEYTAEAQRPLERCIKDAAEADLYVGLFAWRYGHVPAPTDTPPSLPEGVVPGRTSVTEAEYHAAAGRPRLIFLLDESVPWPPRQMDAHAAADRGEAIAALRRRLGERHMVSFFTTPDQLAAQVLAAVRREQLSRQIALRSLQPVDAHPRLMNPESDQPHGLYDTTLLAITDMVQSLDTENYMVVDLGAGRNWWSTRLYFLASLLVDLTEVRLMVFVDQDGRLFGTASAVAVRGILAQRSAAIRQYEDQLAIGLAETDLAMELARRGGMWETQMAGVGGEAQAKTWVRKQELRRYLGDALLHRAVAWPQDDDAAGERIVGVIDQIIRWPQDLVPLVRDEKLMMVVERDALNAEVASYFVRERLQGRL
jgi:hypothetical protein